MKPEIAVHFLVPAGGRGERFGGAVPKQLVEIAGRPLLAWTISRLHTVAPSSITVAVPESYLGDIVELLGRPAGVHFVPGGRSRQESVAHCLAACAAGDQDLVAVHDGARPAVSPADLTSVLEAAATADGAVLGRGASDTLKRVADDLIMETVDRASVFRAETPQVFRREVLEAGLAKAKAEGYAGTDEASLVERLGSVRIVAVAARSRNPKVTQPDDLRLVAALLE